MSTRKRVSARKRHSLHLFGWGRCWFSTIVAGVDKRIDESVAVARVIVTVRGLKVILASDLARIYGVEPKVLNQAVKRNAERFPPDFAIRLGRNEAVDVQRSRSQFVTLKRGENVKYSPLAFTEHGAIMVATVLHSRRAVQMSIFVVRAFLRLREWVEGHAKLSARLTQLERRVGEHDHELRAIIRAVRQLLQSPRPMRRRRIGFDRSEEETGQGATTRVKPPP